MVVCPAATVSVIQAWCLGETERWWRLWTLVAVRPAPSTAPTSLAAGPPARPRRQGEATGRGGKLYPAGGGVRQPGAALPGGGEAGGMAARCHQRRAPGLPKPVALPGRRALHVASLRQRSPRCEPSVKNRRYCRRTAAGEEGCRALPDRERPAWVAWLDASRAAPGEAVSEPAKHPVYLEGEEREREEIKSSPVSLLFVLKACSSAFSCIWLAVYKQNPDGDAFEVELG